MDLNQLFENPFSEVYTGGIINLFGTETTQKITSKIKEINDNRVA